jgi:hypothetical protein
MEWCQFVLCNRLELKESYLSQNKIYHHNRDNRYDIVIGEIADGSSYGNQISFHTEKQF